MSKTLATIGNIFIHSIAEKQLDGSAVGSVLKNEADRGTAIEYVRDAINDSLENREEWAVYKPMENQDLFLAGNHRLSPDMTEDMFKARLHRGEPVLCLDRNKLLLENLKVTTLGCIVYTREQMLDDPQVTEEDKEEMKSGGFEYALVTFLASAHDEPPAVSSHRFVRNLAGGNSSYKNKSTASLIKECQDIVSVEQEYMRVG